MMPVGKPDWWDAAREFLLQDELLAPVVEKYSDGFLSGKGDLFETFVNSIVGQQISVIAAEAIWNRLREKVGEITPENISSFSAEEIAACGLTKSKTSYILGIANNPNEFLNQNYSEMSDDEIHKHFTSYRGIGPWTSEMLMIFSLLRPNVFSIGDIGLVKAVKILNPNLESKDEVLNEAERWSPFKTAASWYLWRMLDPVPVAY
ncbi:MAG: DNA-3-methyladenine glycosylase family protein [Candidatus Poseidoniaceae archaeon]